MKVNFGYRVFRHARKKFLEGDDKVKTGDDLLLVGVKTVERS